VEGPELAGQDTRSERAFILTEKGSLVLELPLPFKRSDSIREKARRVFEQSLALYQTLDDRWGMANALEGLGRTVWLSGACGGAEKLLERSLAIRQALGDQRGVASSLSWLSSVQGQFKEAERLVRESIAAYHKVGDRFGIARGLGILGEKVLWQAKYPEAHSLLEESVAAWNDLGLNPDLAQYSGKQGYAKMHLGRYKQAHDQIQTAFVSVREWEDRQGIGFFSFALGSVALARETYAEALQLLQESVVVYQEIGLRGTSGLPLAVLGIVARGLGNLCQARQHLYDALRAATELRALVFALPAIALLLTDQGEAERAVELYALALRYPFVANSRWFEDVAGRHIAAVAATLPPDAVAAAQERGRARDLEATVAELLAELEEGQRSVAL
jgi:tetratricopeptide (TPR) repeat protein